MTSAIDPSKPTEVTAYTADVRANFQTAADEISALQTQTGTQQSQIATNANAIAALQSQVATLQSQVAANASAIATLQGDVTTLKARQMAAAGVITVNPPNTSSSVYVAAGLAVQFTPHGSARGVVILDGQLGNTTNNCNSALQLYYGTGAPPSAGTLMSATNGQPIGNVVSMLATKNGDLDPFAIAALLSGLVPGSLYWLDVAFLAQSGAATLSQMSLTAFEVLDPLS